MMDDWSSVQTKARQSNTGGKYKRKETNDGGVPEKKDLILANLDERIMKFIDALFNYWKDPSNTIAPEVFFQKMVTFGLAPDIKFIQEITHITHMNRPKPPVRIARVGEKTPTHSRQGSRTNLHKSSKSHRENNIPSPNVS